MVRNKHISDEGTSNSRRESYRGRGRGRGRGRYSKNYRGNYHNSNDQPEYHHQHHYKSKYYADNRSYPEDEDQYEEQIAPGGENMVDLYDDRPNQYNNTEGVNEGHSLQDRISMSGNEHYSGHEGDRAMDDTLRYENTVESDRTGLPPPARDDGSGGANKEYGVSKKEPNPDELRQKVLESLAEKKKKAAEFMNLEKEGASIHKDQPTVNKAAGNSAGEGSGETINPERDAAVDALLATFGSGKEENGAADAASRNNSRTDVVPIRISPGTSDAQQLKHEQYKVDEPRPSSRGDKQQGSRRASDYGHKYDDHDRHRAGREDHIRSRDPSLSSGRHDQRGEGRKPFGYDDDEGRAGGGAGRHDPRYRYDRDRFEDANYPKETKGPGSSSGRKPVVDRYQPVTDDRRDPRDPRNLRDPAGAREMVPFRDLESSRADHAKDAYGAMKPPRYPTDPSLQDAEYSGIGREYPAAYSGAAPRYPPRDDPRYAPAAVPRPAETDYAAMYYRDLTEWLDITGYHDYAYRQMQLQRNREARALEESRYPLEPGYVPRIPRAEEPGPRGPMYAMPPPPLTPAPWDDREAAANRGLPVIPRPGYPPMPEDRGGYRGDELLSGGKTGALKRRPREEEFGEPPHSAKSARHNYESSHRYGADGGSRQGDDAGDETEAVRQVLSRRLASARDRDASPGATDRARRRSMSPRGTSYDGHQRDFSKGNRSPGQSPRFEHGRGRATSKYTPRDDFKKPFHPRRDSLGDSEAPFERKPYGRGRGRGMYKDYIPYDRNEHHFYDRRNNQNNMGELMEKDRPSGFQGGSTRNSEIRYFMIKSFNQDNVKMAQKDNIWATQQKNAEVLEQAFKEARDVLLFFSINKSGKFQGYARMEGLPGSAPVPTWAKNLLWESSGPFRIRWISITDISFHRVAHLKNRLNENQPVLIGRDGQEIDSDCGAALCRTIDEASAFRKLHGANNHNNEE